MPIQTIFTSGIDREGGLETLAFSTIIFSIIVGWILVSVLQRFLEDLWFQTLGMNPRSTLHSFIILVVMFFLFILFIWFVDSLEIIPVSEATGPLAEATGGLVPTEDSATASNAIVQQLSNTRNGHPIVLLNTGV